MTKLNSIMPEGSYTGFLAAMSDAPWAEETNLADLDDMYVLQHSGEKYVVPMMNALLTDGKLTQAAINKAAAYAFAIYGINWARLWEVLQAEYNPIENYNMTEEKTETPSGKETETTSHTGFDTTETTGIAADNTTSNAVYGFNSSSPPTTHTAIPRELPWEMPMPRATR